MSDIWRTSFLLLGRQRSPFVSPLFPPAHALVGPKAPTAAVVPTVTVQTGFRISRRLHVSVAVFTRPDGTSHASMRGKEETIEMIGITKKERIIFRREKRRQLQAVSWHRQLALETGSCAYAWARGARAPTKMWRWRGGPAIAAPRHRHAHTIPAHVVSSNHGELSVVECSSLRESHRHRHHHTTTRPHAIAIATYST